jgi:hypothetical protein
LLGDRDRCLGAEVVVALVRQQQAGKVQ